MALAIFFFVVYFFLYLFSSLTCVLFQLRRFSRSSRYCSYALTLSTRQGLWSLEYPVCPTRDLSVFLSPPPPLPPPPRSLVHRRPGVRVIAEYNIPLLAARGPLWMLLSDISLASDDEKEEEEKSKAKDEKSFRTDPAYPRYIPTAPTHGVVTKTRTKKKPGVCPLGLAPARYVSLLLLLFFL